VEDEDSGPPAIVLDGIRLDEEAFGSRVEIFAGERTLVDYRITNAGGHEAPYPTLYFAAEDCLEHWASKGDNLIGILKPGKSHEDYMSFDPLEDCLGDFTIGLTVETARREFYAEFQVSVVP
jgi:hypothetical protein